MPNYESLTEKQQELYKKLKAEIEKEDQNQFVDPFEGVLESDLLAVLTAIEDQDGKTVTLLGLAISLNNQKSIKAILNAANDKSILEKVLTTVEVYDHEKVKTILKGSDILNEVNLVLNSIITGKSHSAA